MLSSRMKNNPDAARAQLTPFAWELCAARTSTGRAYESIADVARARKEDKLPGDCRQAAQRRALSFGATYLNAGLFLSKPWFALVGTGKSYNSETRSWSCGLTTFALVNFVSSVTRLLPPSKAANLLAISLGLNWPLREMCRSVGITWLIALGASGATLGAGFGCAEFAVAILRKLDCSAALRKGEEIAATSKVGGDRDKLVLGDSTVNAAEGMLNRKLTDTEREKLAAHVNGYLDEVLRLNAETARQEHSEHVDLREQNSENEPTLLNSEKRRKARLQGKEAIA